MRRGPRARPWLIWTPGGISVGLLGLTSPEATLTASPRPEVLFRDPLAVGTEAAADLRRRGARRVVALTHQDMPADKPPAAAAEIDLILGGHGHEPPGAEARKAVVTEAGAASRGLDWELAAIIGRAAAPWEGRRSALRTRETNLGNLVADLMRERMGTDAALRNGGGIRADAVLPPGPITKRDVHALPPFTNILMQLQMSGRDLPGPGTRPGPGRPGGGGSLQLSGVRVTCDPRRRPGNRTLQVAVDGRPLQDGAAYTVAVIDYLVGGGDGFLALREARVPVNAESGPQLADVVLGGIPARGTIAPHTDGRLRPVQN